MSLISVSRILCKFCSDLRHASLYLFPHQTTKINDNIASNICEVKTCACLFEFKVLAFSVIDFLRYLLYQRMTWHDCRMEQNHYQNILLIMFYLEQTTLCRVPYYANNSMCSIQLDDRLKHTLLFFYRDI